MSWDVDFIRRYPCPCGEGEYEEVHKSDDWFRHEVERQMLCSKCRKDYVYDSSVVYGHPGNEVERGWVLKSVLKEEREYVRTVERKVKELYLQDWQSLFTNVKSKKEVWRILTKDGIYHPSLSSIYRYTKGYTHEQMIQFVSSFFTYSNLDRIFDILNIRPDAEVLGLNENDVERLIG